MTTPARQRSATEPSTGLPAWRIGVSGGVVGLLCCVGPTVLALLGVVSAGTAFAWATGLYDGYGWWFRLGGLLVMAVLVWSALRRRDQCSLAGVRRVQRLLLLALAVAVGTYLALRRHHLARNVGMSATTAPQIRLYWRPGCPYCARLRRDLDRIGLPRQEVDIWRDPQARSVVRALADGNETVPTVVVDGVGLVNRPPPGVVDLVGQRRPDLLRELGAGPNGILLLDRGGAAWSAPWPLPSGPGGDDER